MQAAGAGRAVCCRCKTLKAAAHFSKTQYKKHRKGLAKCAPCVEALLAEEGDRKGSSAGTSGKTSTSSQTCKQTVEPSAAAAVENPASPNSVAQVGDFDSDSSAPSTALEQTPTKAQAAHATAEKPPTTKPSPPPPPPTTTTTTTPEDKEQASNSSAGQQEPERQAQGADAALAACRRKLIKEAGLDAGVVNKTIVGIVNRINADELTVGDAVSFLDEFVLKRKVRKELELLYSKKKAEAKMAKYKDRMDDLWKIVLEKKAKRLKKRKRPSEQSDDDAAPTPAKKRCCCDRCDGPHETERCPHFKKPREKHPDAQKRKGIVGLGGNGGNVFVRAQDVRVFPQPGDGSCLFHSLRKGLGSKGLSSTFALRQSLAQWVRKNSHVKIADTPVREWVRWDANCSVEAYARRMQSAAWGGGIEMAACSRLFNVKIHVYERCRQGYKRISCFDSTRASHTISVLYQGGMHYDAIQINGPFHKIKAVPHVARVSPARPPRKLVGWGRNKHKHHKNRMFFKRR
ncbi:Ubiquitin thioesterase OTU1 (OTU domain-containing protein 1) [Durusdinium trenchii]|uniref:Ubiquitin thioesterase OTU n=1 Tax=Durusdinium trenchii TaxID=1381693 RepID=A0ABP0RP33_9DINO